jgi:hypothetical protein
MKVAKVVARARTAGSKLFQSGQHVVSMGQSHGPGIDPGVGGGVGSTGLITGITASYGVENFPARTNVACAGSDRLVAVRVTAM